MLWLLCGLAGVALVGCSRGDDPGLGEVAEQRSSQVRAAARSAGLADDVADVVALAARAPAATFSAVYRVEGSTETVVVHQRPPRRRVDVVDGEGRTVSAFVSDGSSAVRCERRGASWQCADADEATDPSPTIGAFDPAVLDRTIAALADAKTPVTAERTTVAGAIARCVRSGPAERFCVSASGVPLLIEGPEASGTLRATTYRTTVDDDDLGRPTA